MIRKTMAVANRSGSRLSPFLAVLFLLLIAETVVLFLQNYGVALPIARVIIEAFHHIRQAGATFWAWLWKMVGPVVFPLVALTALEIWAFVKLVNYRVCNYEDDGAYRYLKIMGIIEGSAPGFGFLGTCIGLIATMKGMDPQLNQVQMLKAVFDNSASAFGSTIYGILLGITAFITKEIFRDLVKLPEEQSGLNSGQTANHKE